MFSLKKCLKLEFVPIIRKKYGQFSENPQFGNKVWFSGPKTTLDRTDLAAIYWENALKFKHCVLFKPNIGFTQNYEFIEKLSKVLNCASLLSVWLMQLVFHIDLDKINTIRPKSAVSNHDAHFYFSPGTREKQLPTWDTNQTRRALPPPMWLESPYSKGVWHWRRWGQGCIFCQDTAQFPYKDIFN